MAAPETLSARSVTPTDFTLRGERLRLRLLAPGDAARLQDFFYSHTAETIQLRYGHAVVRMTHERAADLVGVDQARDLAIAIFSSSGADEVIHAIGRYYLDPGGTSAEVAFVVRETKRRLGLGTLLLQTLVDAARARGLNALWGRVRRDNLPMLALFRRFGGKPVHTADAGDSEMEVRIPLDPPTVAAKTPRPARRGRKRTPAAANPKTIQES
jgi:GNAT superfamily N-acetyltransferase